MQRSSFILFFVIFFTGIQYLARAQDGIFSQYYSAPLYVNPSLINLDRYVDFGVNYRSQLLNSGYTYTSTQASLIYPIITQNARDATLLNHKGAGGLSAFSEAIGKNNLYKTTGVLLTAGYNLHLNEKSTTRLAFAVQGGYVQQQINQEAFKWGSQYVNLQGFDLELPPGLNVQQPTQGYPVVNAGVTFLKAVPKDEADSTSRAKFFYMGFSASYLNQPGVDFEVVRKSPKAMLFRGQMGIDIPVGLKLKFSPNVFFQMRDGLSQLYGGLYAYYSLRSASAGGIAQNSDELPTNKEMTVIAGLWYRHGDAAVGMVGFRFDRYTLGVSYDYRLSKVSEGLLNNDYLEVSLRIRLRGKIREEKVKIYKPMLII